MRVYDVIADLQAGLRIPRVAEQYISSNGLEFITACINTGPVACVPMHL
jgi:hypothetical protein